MENENAKLENLELNQSKTDFLELDDLMVALHVIGELKANDKLAIYAGHITIHSSNTLLEKIMTKLKRNYYFESKEVSYQFIKTCIASLEHHIHVLQQKQDTNTLSRIKSYIEQAREGLNNLQQTYYDHVNMKAKLKCQIEKLGILYDNIL